jgi:hypothetical protein
MTRARRRSNSHAAGKGAKRAVLIGFLAFGASILQAETLLMKSGKAAEAAGLLDSAYSTLTGLALDEDDPGWEETKQTAEDLTSKVSPRPSKCRVCPSVFQGTHCSRHGDPVPEWGSRAWLRKRDQMSYFACQLGSTVSYWFQ